MLVFRNLDHWRRRCQEAQRRVSRELSQCGARIGEVVRREAISQFAGERTRALYQIVGGKRRKRKRPRPVTSPPHQLGIFSGLYRRTISYQVTTSGRAVRVEVGPVGIQYPRAHEYGLGRMPKRPVLEPAVAAARPVVERIWRRPVEVI